ncbi:hypothetical protein [Helicobacter sp. 23-1045]
MAIQIEILRKATKFAESALISPQIRRIYKIFAESCVIFALDSAFLQDSAICLENNARFCDFLDFRRI